MKRCPLKRGKPIRRKRKTERKNQDVNQRRLYLQSLFDRGIDCEFRGNFDPPGGHWGRIECHHIARLRWDDPAFFVGLCSRCHSLGHDNDSSFTSRCLFVKWRSGGLDLHKLNERVRGRRLQCFIEVAEGMDSRTIAAVEEMRKAGLHESD